MFANVWRALCAKVSNLWSNFCFWVRGLFNLSNAINVTVFGSLVLGFTPGTAASEASNVPAYVCLETNSTAVREEIVEIIQDSNAHLVSCDHSYDFRIVTNKSEMRHGTFVTEVRISFDVYDVHGSNVTWEPTLTSGPYYRDEDEARRIHNVSLQIQRLIRQNRQTYLSSVNGL